MMSLLELFSRVFPLAKLDHTASHLYPCCYDENNNYDFWTKDLSDDTIKDIAKRFVEVIYGVPNYHVFLHETDSNKYQTIVTGGRNCDKTYCTNLARQRSLELEGWQQLPSIFNTVPIADILEILDDALDNGFDVKVVDGIIYYREKSNEEH